MPETDRATKMHYRCAERNALQRDDIPFRANPISPRANHSERGLARLIVTFSLTLDGFAIYGTHNDCSAIVDGGASAKIGKNYLVSNDTVDGSEIFSYYFTLPKNNKGKVYLYEETPSGVSFVTKSKYDVTGTAAVGRPGKSIVAR